ncbi:MAG: A24 family peptidase [Thermoguttaceae bacterium]|nr:A24 family peptidase [Thermoguttaceae bacterium]
MNGILAVPLEIRLAVLFALGVVAGVLANVAIYRLAWNRRPIGPWLAPSPEASPRRWFDRLPVLGWFGLRREATLHGPGYWIRPLAVEVFFGLVAAALYWWEIARSGLMHPHAPDWVGAVFAARLHAEYASHVTLFWFMLVASLIDLDEKTIPDAITVPGTLVGLSIAAACPFALLPVPWFWPPGVLPQRADFGFMTLVSPHLWITWVEDLATWGMALVALGCWWLWCVALMHRTWYARHGWCRAVGLMLARLGRTPTTWRIVGMGLAGTLVIAALWAGGGLRWVAVLTSLVGMGAAASVIWAVRILGSAVLQREAMGFGDVTLMAMLGAFLGWQASLMVFFLAPLAGIAIGLPMLVFRREAEIPYGPFLCLAAAAVVVFWSPLWNLVQPYFLVLGGWIPAFVVACLAMLPLLLWLIRGMRRVLSI